jgi:hypothetical protein
MGRRRFTEKDVIRTLIHQGVEIRDFRTDERITLDNVDQIEREHLHEVALGGPDEPANCRYSLKASHDVISNGNGATTAGSSKNRIAKATQPKRIAKFVVNKQPPGATPPPTTGRAWPSRRMQSRPFAPRGSRPMNRKHRA